MVMPAEDIQATMVQGRDQRAQAASSCRHQRAMAKAKPGEADITMYSVGGCITMLVCSSGLRSLPSTGWELAHEMDSR